MLIGYARVSTQDQNLSLQQEALKKAGCRPIFEDNISGARSERAGLEIARQMGRRGGRKRKMTESKIDSAKKLLANGVPPYDVANSLSVSIPTLYCWVPASIAH